MIVRYFSSAALGLLVATGLLWLMQFLIDIGPEAFVDERPGRIPIWIAEHKPEVINDDQELPERPPAPVDPPPDHRPPAEGSGGPAIDPPTIGVPDEPPGWEIPGLGMTDGPLVAMMTVRPVYPLRPASLGLEGHVIVQFDVNETGAVVNVTVVEASHGMFERAAIEAAKQSKFRPRVVDGMPVATTGVRKLYTFELEK